MSIASRKYTSVNELFSKALELDRTNHLSKELEKVGNLRAGNSGILSTNGTIAGSCHRVTHLRSLNIEVEIPNLQSLIMFELGKANEFIWQTKLESVWEGKILAEEEIPINWNTTNGTKVSGRPDLVLIDKDGVAQVGIELKMVASVWTSRDVMFDTTPKLDHITQAAHYSWKLGIPYRIIYTQYVDQTVEKWAAKFFPKQGDRNSEYIDYNDKGDIRKIRPFYVIYELLIDPKTGIVSYKLEGASDSEMVNTVVTIGDIERYYEYVSTMAERKDLGPRPLTIGPNGEEKNWSKCDYCALQVTCAANDKSGYDKWLEAVKRLVSKRDSKP